MLNWPDSLVRSTAPTVFTHRTQRHREDSICRQKGQKREKRRRSLSKIVVVERKKYLDFEYEMQRKNDERNECKKNE